jgi:hypothetical protein
MSVFKDIINGVSGLVRSIGRGIRNVGRGIRGTLGLIAKPFKKLGIVGTIALGVMMPWSVGPMFKGITSTEGWLAQTARGLVQDESLVKKAVGFVMSGVHKGAALTQQGLSYAKNFITDKIQEGNEWLDKDIKKNGVERATDFPVDDINTNLYYDAEQELYKELMEEEKTTASKKENVTAFKKQDSNDSLLAQGFNRMKNKFVEGAESGAKDFGYRVFGGKGSPDQGAFDNPNDLGQTSAYEVPEVYDFIDNRNYLAFSNLEEDLRNNQGFNYGTVEYNLGVNSALKNISSYYTPEINLG